LAHFLILSHTFSVLAHCADLSKSEGQLCSCHETGLKPVLVKIRHDALAGMVFNSSHALLGKFI